VTQELELGYTFDATYWGHAYATEAAQCVFAYARDVLKLRRVISVIDGENGRSLRVAERCGLRHGRTQIAVLGRLLHIYLWPL
jgi:RimJ/RimL family protein N-acetyltransferase